MFNRHQIILFLTCLGLINIEASQRAAAPATQAQTSAPATPTATTAPSRPAVAPIKVEVVTRKYEWRTRTGGGRSEEAYIETEKPVETYEIPTNKSQALMAEVNRQSKSQVTARSTLVDGGRQESFTVNIAVEKVSDQNFRAIISPLTIDGSYDAGHKLILPLWSKGVGLELAIEKSVIDDPTSKLGEIFRIENLVGYEESRAAEIKSGKDETNMVIKYKLGLDLFEKAIDSLCVIDDKYQSKEKDYIVIQHFPRGISNLRPYTTLTLGRRSYDDRARKLQNKTKATLTITESLTNSFAGDIGTKLQELKKLTGDYPKTSTEPVDPQLQAKTEAIKALLAAVLKEVKDEFAKQVKQKQIELGLKVA